jgi:lysophospholipase L1-like esterase
MPRVFLIGDSITGGFGDPTTGYAPLVRETLSAEGISVATLPENGRDSRCLLTGLPSWLRSQDSGHPHFDVIHFNCGLHDVKRLHDAQGRPSATTAVPIEEYEANLHEIIACLWEHALMLVWARTTPVLDGQRCPEKGFDRRNADVEAYNAVADRVMASYGIPVNDLHGAIMRAGATNCLLDDGVHMTELGNQLLAIHVSAILRKTVAVATGQQPAQ